MNGLSTSLPPDVQRRFLARVPGLEQARMTQPGYAIEYDYYPAEELEATLRLKLLKGQYLAGQVNGSTGYEEAAGQGIVAGINAALCALGRETWVSARDEAYLGVLVDYLVTRVGRRAVPPVHLARRASPDSAPGQLPGAAGPGRGASRAADRG